MTTAETPFASEGGQCIALSLCEGERSADYCVGLGLRTEASQELEGNSTGLLFGDLLVAGGGGGNDIVGGVEDAHGKDTVVGRAFDGDFLVAGRRVEAGLEQAQELVLVVRILRDKLDEVDVTLDDVNDEFIAVAEAPPNVLFLEVHCPNPCLEQGPHNAQVIPTIADIFHVAAENNPRAKSDTLGELAELLIIDDSTQNPGQESLSLTRIPFREIRGDNEAEHTVSEEFEFLVVIFTKREAALGFLGENGDLIAAIGLFMPEFGAVDIGFVAARLGEEFEVVKAAFPAIDSQNRDRIRRTEFPIPCIPRIEDFGGDGGGNGLHCQRLLYRCDMALSSFWIQGKTKRV